MSALQQLSPGRTPAPVVMSAAAKGSVLQRKCACGNHASSIECESCAKEKVQRKMSIGASNDPLELEADRVADQVLANDYHSSEQSLNSPRIQRHTAATAGDTESVPESVTSVLEGSGQPLPATVRRDMEQGFGEDFSSVRIHTTNAAARSARDIQAHAYTLGNHIVFNSGKFAPSNTEGKRLLAHELTHVVQQSSGASRTIARAPDPKAPKSNFTPQQQARLELARQNQKADGTRIVGVLLTPDGQEFEFISGGPGRFYAHIEGKAVAKMNELGIKKGVLLVEKEPCQTCDRSTYTYDPLRPAEGGPEVPLRSSKTGKELAREPSMINTGLYKGSTLKVIDPVSTGIYRGLKTPPQNAPGSGSLPPVGPTAAPGSNPAAAASAMPKDAPTDTAAPSNSPPQAPAANKPIAPPAQAKPPASNPAVPSPPLAKPPVSQPAPTSSVPRASGAPPVVAAPKTALPPVAPPKVATPAVAPPNVAAPAVTAPAATTPAKPPAAVAPTAAKPAVAGGRQRFSAGVPSTSPPVTIDTSKGQAKGQGAVLAIQGVLAILTYFADKHQRARADAAWAEAYPRIQEEVTRTGRGVVVYIEYTQNEGSSVLIFEGIHWGSGGQDTGRPGSIRAPGQNAVFSRSYVGPTEAQAAISDESALIYRRDEARTRQIDLQRLAEVLANEGWLGRKLRERAGDSISALRAYDAKAHIVSASQSIKDKRYSDAAASLDKAETALDDMWAQIKAYVGEKKMKEVSGED